MASISKGMSTILSVFFVEQISKPFTKWKAFEMGLIDNKGKKLRNAKTAAEKKEFNSFNNVVRNIKKLLNKLPGGSSKVGSAIAAIKLLQEEFEMDADLALELLEERWCITEPYVTKRKPDDFLFDTVYNNIDNKALIKTEESQHEVVNIGKHQITKITKDDKIYFVN